MWLPYSQSRFSNSPKAEHAGSWLNIVQIPSTPHAASFTVGSLGGNQRMPSFKQHSAFAFPSLPLEVFFLLGAFKAESLLPSNANKQPLQPGECRQLRNEAALKALVTQAPRFGVSDRSL